jgi:hypothetical protein
MGGGYLCIPISCFVPPRHLTLFAVGAINVKSAGLRGFVYLLGKAECGSTSEVLGKKRPGPETCSIFETAMFAGFLEGGCYVGSTKRGAAGA